jgi:protein-tyrosine phosphatase
LADIQSHAEQGGLVYMHCRAGVGRTGTVAACLLVDQGYSGDEALALLKQKWQAVHKRVLTPHTPETEGQRQFVRQWATLRSA